jgi:hypothetical protein
LKASRLGAQIDKPCAEWMNSALFFLLSPRFWHKLSLLAQNRDYAQNPSMSEIAWFQQLTSG